MFLQCADAGVWAGCRKSRLASSHQRPGRWLPRRHKKVIAVAAAGLAALAAAGQQQLLPPGQQRLKQTPARQLPRQAALQWQLHRQRVCQLQRGQCGPSTDHSSI